MPMVKKVDPELSRIRSEEEGREVVAYNYSWEGDDWQEGMGFLFTGPVAGSVRTEDGTTYDVTPEVVVVHKPDHHAELLGHIDAMHRQSGYLPAED